MSDMKGRRRTITVRVADREGPPGERAEPDEPAHERCVMATVYGPVAVHRAQVTGGDCPEGLYSVTLVALGRNVPREFSRSRAHFVARALAALPVLADIRCDDDWKALSDEQKREVAMTVELAGIFV